MLCLPLCKFTAHAQLFINQAQNLPLPATSINSMDIESADLDGDGDLDIVVAVEASRNLLLFNDGEGVFTEDPARFFPKKDANNPFAGEDSEDIALVDFDNDDDLDVLMVTEDTPFHELLTNDGTGTFSHIDFDFDTSQGNAVAVLDLNGDTFLDIIIGNTGQNDVYINNQDLTFTKDNNRWPVNTEGTQDFKLIDLDGDDDLDIIEGIDAGSNNILINEEGFFAEENDRLPNVGLNLETRKISVGDINGDQHPDLFICTVNFTGFANLQNRLYLNDGTGFFSDVTNNNLPVFIEQTLDAVFLDYDFDGDQDLITLGFTTPDNSYRAFENDGSGVFSEQTADVFESFNMTNGIALHVADFNDDDLPDIYFGGFNQIDHLAFYDPSAITTSTVDRELQELHTFPNPARSVVFIQFPTNGVALAGAHLSVYDSVGRLVKSIALPAQRMEQFQLDVSELVAGAYQFRVSKEGKGFAVGRFVVSR
ncbi:MAG: FG-GAP-like repeat-containing protein [Bacteroidota bacterium]